MNILPSTSLEAGGYYVRYPDGYESWSPAEAFEEGYTLVEEQAEGLWAGIKTPAKEMQNPVSIRVERKGMFQFLVPADRRVRGPMAKTL